MDCFTLLSLGPYMVYCLTKVYIKLFRRIWSGQGTIYRQLPLCRRYRLSILGCIRAHKPVLTFKFRHGLDGTCSSLSRSHSQPEIVIVKPLPPLWTISKEVVKVPNRSYTFFRPDGLRMQLPGFGIGVPFPAIKYRVSFLRVGQISTIRAT